MNRLNKISRNKKLKSKVKKYLLLSFVFIMLIGLYIIEETGIIRLGGNASSSSNICNPNSACHQSGFLDNNFYKAVIDNYNNQNSESLTYNSVISSQQLGNIITLNAINSNISNTAGIEKLTSLKYLNLSSNEISEINLSGLRGLIKLDLRNNSISNIDLTKNTSLTNLNLSNNLLSSIDLKNNSRLVSLSLDNNMISAININNLHSLTELSLSPKLYNSIDYGQLNSLVQIKNDIALLPGEVFHIYEYIPYYFNVTNVINENSEYAVYQGDYIEAKKPGFDNIKVYFNNNKYMECNIAIFDSLDSNKYDVDDRFIYVGLDNNFKKDDMSLVINNRMILSRYGSNSGLDYQLGFDNDAKVLKLEFVDDNENYFAIDYKIGLIDAINNVSNYSIEDDTIYVTIDENQGYKKEDFNTNSFVSYNLKPYYSDSSKKLFIRNLNKEEMDVYKVKVTVKKKINNPVLIIDTTTQKKNITTKSGNASTTSQNATKGNEQITTNKVDQTKSSKTALIVLSTTGSEKVTIKTNDNTNKSFVIQRSNILKIIIVFVLLFMSMTLFVLHLKKKSIKK